MASENTFSYNYQKEVEQKDSNNITM